MSLKSSSIRIKFMPRDTVHVSITDAQGNQGAAAGSSARTVAYLPFFDLRRKHSNVRGVSVISDVQGACLIHHKVTNDTALLFY
jgi:hypothetical protein